MWFLAPCISVSDLIGWQLCLVFYMWCFVFFKAVFPLTVFTKFPLKNLSGWLTRLECCVSVCVSSMYEVSYCLLPEFWELTHTEDFLHLLSRLPWIQDCDASRHIILDLGCESLFISADIVTNIACFLLSLGCSDAKILFLPATCSGPNKPTQLLRPTQQAPQFEKRWATVSLLARDSKNVLLDLQLISRLHNHHLRLLSSTCLLSSQQINHSQEDLYPPPGVLRPEERMQQHYQHRDLDYQHRDLDYQRGLPGKTGVHRWVMMIVILTYVYTLSDGI